MKGCERMLDGYHSPVPWRCEARPAIEYAIVESHFTGIAKRYTQTLCADCVSELRESPAKYMSVRKTRRKPR